MRTIHLLILSTLLFTLGSCNCQKQTNPQIEQYNVVWDTPSSNALESMPVGGGDIGCNAWVENGDLMLYMQRSGCFSENGEYLKLGRIRLTMTPNPFENIEVFRQELLLREGYVQFACKDTKQNNVMVNLWVDIDTHSIHFDITSEQEISLEAAYQNWRTEDKLLLDDNRGRYSCFSLEGYPHDVVKKSDVVTFEKNHILFYHRNGSQTLSPDVMIAQQEMSDYKEQIVNNVRHLTFGGILHGEGMQVKGTDEGVYCDTPYQEWVLASNAPRKSHHISISTHKKQCDHVAEFIAELNTIQETDKAQKGNFDKNRTWWSDFWERSWIITDPQQKSTDSLTWQMGRNYQLFRYQLGCNLYGDSPTKFNGGNFTVDPSLTTPEMRHDPDWRAWGGDIFTAQNQRLLYWPMLKAGDTDGLKSQFNLYEQGLAGAKAKVQKYFGHRGAAFTEYASASGLDFGAGWGWSDGTKRIRGKELPFGHPDANATNTYNMPVERGIVANGWCAYHWESQVEHAYMMLEQHRFTGANIDRYMPFIKESLIFFDEHYQKRQLMRNGKPLDEEGKLVFFPSTSCESYRGAKNPADLVTGIAACLESLIELESDSLNSADKAYFAAYLERLPSLYFGEVAGDKIVKPAESYIKYINMECPQFYPLFPFNRYDLESDMIPIFRNTWKHGEFPKNMYQSWHQDGIFFARMGMVEEAMAYNQEKLKDSPRRFPTFWGPGHDWVPDHNWGGSGAIGLQEMLMQTIGDKTHILPAWDKSKDVCFKLHAPHNTTVEVEYIDGEFKKLEVKPASRKKDIKIF